MARGRDGVTKLLRSIESAWAALEESYAGLPDSSLAEPGAMGEWSIKDILAHISTWEAEAITHLPTIIASGRPPRYITYGGLDAFNAQMAERKRGLSLAEVRAELEETHRRLLAFIGSVPEEQIAAGTRARRRLRLDTYGHYPLHAAAIRAWRERQGGTPQ